MGPFSSQQMSRFFQGDSSALRFPEGLAVVKSHNPTACPSLSSHVAGNARIHRKAQAASIVLSHGFLTAAAGILSSKVGQTDWWPLERRDESLSLLAERFTALCKALSRYSADWRCSENMLLRRQAASCNKSLGLRGLGTRVLATCWAQGMMKELPRMAASRSFSYCWRKSFKPPQVRPEATQV